MVQLLTCTANTSIRRISPCRSIQKALYRFLNNKKVEENILIDELCSRSSSLCSGRHVLCIQDTTEMNFFSQAQRIKEDSGLGRLDGAKPTLGFKMHSTLMLDATSSDILGFSDVKLWHRPIGMPDRRQRKYKGLPIEQKESYKWIEAAIKSKERLKAAHTVTFIEDREGDIYEQLCSLADANVHYVIRSKANRNSIEGIKIWDLLGQQQAIGSYKIKLSTDHRKGRKKSEVTLKVRFAQTAVTNGKPWHNRHCPSSVPLTVIEAYEDVPNGISWTLLTTHSIKNFDDAYQIIEW